MTLKDACLLIGVKEDTPVSEVKSKYRQLMHRYHPDAVESKESETSENNVKMAAMLNEAYDVLLKRNLHAVAERAEETQRENRAGWNAPVVNNAYEMREILQPVEDANGNVYANISVARGKFVWTKDEEFGMFMLSIYKLSKSILDRIDNKVRREDIENKCRDIYQAELAYLLARQFINGTEALEFILGEGTTDDNGLRMYCVKGMLEKNPAAKSPARAEFLYPEKVVNHRLYLKNNLGKSIGYLSFPDNRLYYILIPLFEERKVQVMIMQNPEMAGRNNNTDLYVWIKILPQNSNIPDVDYNVKIRRLLDMYSL